MFSAASRAAVAPKTNRVSSTRALIAAVLRRAVSQLGRRKASAVLSEHGLVQRSSAWPKRSRWWAQSH